jgi:hypothetical protein
MPKIPPDPSPAHEAEESPTEESAEHATGMEMGDEQVAGDNTMELIKQLAIAAILGR